jgi:hypothetical protein
MSHVQSTAAGGRLNLFVESREFHNQRCLRCGGANAVGRQFSLSKWLLVAIIVSAIAPNLGATAITIFNTGVCGGNNPTSGASCSGGLLLTSPAQFDNNYRLIARSDGGVTGNNSSQTTPPVGGSPGYVAQNTTSDWITPVPGGNLPSGTYTIQTSFSLAGFVANTMVLSMSVAADNLVAVRINGGSTNVFTPACTALPVPGPACFQQFFSTTINNAAVVTANGAGWNAGTNTIEFVLTNTDGGSPSGLRVEVSGDATVQSAIGAPTITKTFGAASIGVGESVALTFTLSNPNAATTLTGLAFTDTLPAGLIVSTPNGLVGSCGGTITATAGSNSIALAGTTLAAGASCTFSVNVTATGTPEGLLTNTTGTLTSTQAPAGAAASARIFVGNPSLISYFSNVNVGDSVINITNAGTQNTAGALTNICANVYAFSPDEQLISCCSCTVTPNALVSLSARSDLISNTLTPGVPTSIVVKVLATAGTACNASNVPVANLASGMRAWGTKLHSLPGTSVTFGLTEVPFSQSGLSAADLARLTSFCGFIQANGSGFGICKSCRLGGLGSVSQ